MRLKDDDSEVRTVMGSICSIIVLAVTAFYAYLKMVVLIEKKDVDILSTVKELYYTDHDYFRYKDGLNIAVAFTGYDNIEEPILPPQIGELVWNSNSWGNDENGDPFVERLPLDDHACTRDELNLDDAVNPKFFKTHSS